MIGESLILIDLSLSVHISNLDHDKFPRRYCFTFFSSSCSYRYKYEQLDATQYTENRKQSNGVRITKMDSIDPHYLPFQNCQKEQLKLLLKSIKTDL